MQTATPAVLAHTRPLPTPIRLTRPAPHEVIPGHTPYEHDLRTRDADGAIAWALSHHAGIHVQRSRDLITLLDDLIARVDRLHPDGREQGVIVYLRWPSRAWSCLADVPVSVLREHTTLYLALTAPHIELRERVGTTSPRGLWALMGAHLRQDSLEHLPALPYPRSAHDTTNSPQRRVPLVVAADASATDRQAGWAYTTSDGDYATGSCVYRTSRTRLSAAQLLTQATKYETKVLMDALMAHRDIARFRGVVLLSDNRTAVYTVNTWLTKNPHIKGFQVCWTRGHAGHVLNEAADRLSRMARVGQGTQNETVMNTIANEAAALWHRGVRRVPNTYAA